MQKCYINPFYHFFGLSYFLSCNLSVFLSVNLFPVDLLPSICFLSIFFSVCNVKGGCQCTCSDVLTSSFRFFNGISTLPAFLSTKVMFPWSTREPPEILQYFSIQFLNIQFLLKLIRVLWSWRRPARSPEVDPTKLFSSFMHNLPVFRY